VFVHFPDGRIEIYAYPEAVFHPTDFHTATIVGDSIYIIGSLGYPDQRRYGTTPVYRLDLATMAMHMSTCTGAAPGWIYGHRTQVLHSGEIQISGGNIQEQNGESVEEHPNQMAFLLDPSTLSWRIASAQNIQE
jgi:hypothetical protein